jgi:hypothetical protein
VGAVRAPGRTIAAAREAAEGLGEVAWGLINAAPKTPLNQPIGPHRRIAWVPMKLARDLKDSKQALGAEVIAGLENFQPPTIFARASRLHFSTRAYNLLVTNVPGPQFPLYLLGRELEELIPVAFLAPDQTLAVAIMSYNGKVNVSLIADYDSFPDLDELAAHVEECKAELLDVAESERMPATTT